MVCFLNRHEAQECLEPKRVAAGNTGQHQGKTRLKREYKSTERKRNYFTEEGKQIVVI